LSEDQDVFMGDGRQREAVVACSTRGKGEQAGLALDVLASDSGEGATQRSTGSSPALIVAWRIWLGGR
jgi:hypothetical protein